MLMQCKVIILILVKVLYSLQFVFIINFSNTYNYHAKNNNPESR